MELLFFNNIPILQINSFLFLNFDYHGHLNIVKSVNNEIVITKSQITFINTIYLSTQTIPLTLKIYLYNNLNKDTFEELVQNPEIVCNFLLSSLYFFNANHNFSKKNFV